MYHVPLLLGQGVAGGAGLSSDWPIHGPKTENPTKEGWRLSSGSAAAMSAASSVSFRVAHPSGWQGGEALVAAPKQAEMATPTRTCLAWLRSAVVR